MSEAREILEQWDFGPGSPPLPGRVAARLAEIIPRFSEAIEQSDPAALRRALEQLDSLRRALELWTSVELDHAALSSELPKNPSENG